MIKKRIVKQIAWQPSTRNSLLNSKNFLYYDKKYIVIITCVAHNNNSFMYQSFSGLNEIFCFDCRARNKSRKTQEFSQ